jgi:hypothetical protein
VPGSVHSFWAPAYSATWALAVGTNFSLVRLSTAERDNYFAAPGQLNRAFARRVQCNTNKILV